MWKLYESMKLSNVFIRQYMLPNPFEGYPNADLYNYATGFALYPVTYIIVGLFYRKGSSPLLGSFLYLLFYLVHTGLIAFAGVFSFSKLAIHVIVGLYIAILLGVKSLQYRIKY